MAVSQRMLPLRCVICRTKIIRLKQTTGGFATPASHTPHLANTRACLLRQPGAIDPEGFGRSPFLTPEDYEKPQPAKQYVYQTGNILFICNLSLEIENTNRFFSMLCI